MVDGPHYPTVKKHGFFFFIIIFAIMYNKENYLSADMVTFPVRCSCKIYRRSIGCQHFVTVTKFLDMGKASGQRTLCFFGNSRL